MRLLLDTHALLWTLAEPERLSSHAADEIGDQSNQVFVSAVSAWEIGVKRAKGRLEAPEDLLAMLAEKRFDALAVTMAHALAVEALPHHHHDPFDRMLIAQAQIENLVLVTSDQEMRRYPIAVMRAT